MRFEPYGTSSWWNEVPYGLAFFVVTLGAMFSTNGWVQWAIVVLTIASATWIAWMLWRRGTRARVARRP